MGITTSSRRHPDLDCIPKCRPDSPDNLRCPRAFVTTYYAGNVLTMYNADHDDRLFSRRRTDYM